VNVITFKQYYEIILCLGSL